GRWSVVLVELMIQVIGGTNEAEMGEGLGEVAQQFAVVADFFRIQSEVVGVAESLFEDQAGQLDVARAGQAFGIPEGRGGKSPLASVEASVRAFKNVVAINEGIFSQARLDGLEGGEPAGVGGADEFDERQEEGRGVQGLGATILHEALEARTP